MKKLHNQMQILVVDDDQDFVDALTSLIEKNGYQVVPATNGSEASKIMESREVDIVISDMRMPNGSGSELVGWARKNFPEKPIILLVSGTHDYAINADVLFSKPINKQGLLFAIDKLNQTETTFFNIKRPFRLKIRTHIQGKLQDLEVQVLRYWHNGMFIALPEEQYPSISTSISFTGSTPSLNGRGIVRWIKPTNSPYFPAGCSIEFEYLSPDLKELFLQISQTENLKDVA